MRCVAFSPREKFEWLRRARRTRAPSASSASASWAAPSPRISPPPAGAWSATTSAPRAAARPRAPASRSPRNAADVAAAVPTILTSLPKPQASMDTVREIAAAKLPRKVLVEMSTFAISDKEKAERVLAKAGHVMLDTPVSGTGSQAANRDLVFYASGDAAAISKLRPMFRSLRPPRLRRRRLRQRQQDEIRRQSAGRHQQRRQRRGHGARHEGRPAAATDLRSDHARRRQFARVRIARADDGEGQLQRRHHEDRRLGQGHAGDRRLRPQDQSADADVRRHASRSTSRR